MWNRLRAKRTVYVGAVVIGVVVVFGLGVLTGDGRLRLVPVGQFKAVSGLPSTLDYASVNQVYDTLRQNYNGKLTESQVLDGLKHGLAESTGDPYTQYFTPKEAKAFMGDLDGQTLTGIGAQLDEDQQGNVVVMAPLEGSPAAKAGVKAKDIIASINGESTAGMSLNTAVSKIRGKKGTTVTLGLIRGQQPFSLTITRDTVSVPNATGKILDGTIGYIQVSQFSDGDQQGNNSSFTLVQQQVVKFKAAGVKKIILDLRDNPGGEVDSAKNIASLWLPKNALIEAERRGNTVVDSDSATGNNPLLGMPTVVLVNAGSASASEITTLALRDHKAAYVIGEKSYGKGVVQSVIPFADGSQLKVTIAKWYSPNGTNINHKGIVPDQIVKEPSDATADNDAQLQAAEKYLANK